MSTVEELRDKLTRHYRELEVQARELLKAGKAVANPGLLLTDPQYSLGVVGFIQGPGADYLYTVTKRLRNVEPAIMQEPAGFLHVTFGDVIFNPDGRKSTASGPTINAQKMKDYYFSIRANVRPDGPINYELYGIIPTRRHVDEDKYSIDVIAALLPVDNRPLEVREQINKGIVSLNWTSANKLGGIHMQYTTLGRLPTVPQKTGEPLLTLIDRVNQEIAQRGLATEIVEIDVHSASRNSYIWLKKRLLLSPPISLVDPGQNQLPVRIILPRQRRKLEH